MSKTFRPWKIDDPLLLPPMVQDFVAKDHLARFVLSLVRDDVDLAEITGTYGSERGQPPFDPTMMTTLLLYSYCCGIYSSRRIAKACRERVDFMSIVGLDAPDFRTISNFRKRHLKALGGLFGQILHLWCSSQPRVSRYHESNWINIEIVIALLARFAKRCSDNAMLDCTRPLVDLTPYEAYQCFLHRYLADDWEELSRNVDGLHQHHYR